MCDGENVHRVNELDISKAGERVSLKGCSLKHSTFLKLKILLGLQ